MSRFVLSLSLSLLMLMPSISESAAIYIRPKAYLDVVTGKMVYGKIIGIDHGSIISIGESHPNNAKIQEYPTIFIMPGLFDCHTHVLFTQQIEDVHFEKALLREVKINDEQRVERGRRFLKDYLANGFTAICDLGNSGDFLDMTLRDSVITNSNYPDMYISGPGIATDKGQFFPNAESADVAKEYLILNEKSNIKKILKKYIRHRVDILKVYLDNSPGKGSMSSSLVNKILNSPLSKKFKKVTFHAIEKTSVDQLLNYDNISIEHGTATGWSKATKGKNIYLTMTDLSVETLKEFNYYNTVFYAGQILRAKEANKHNVNLVFGTDFYFHKNTPFLDRGAYAMRSIDAWRAASIPNIDILRALTINASKSLQLEKKTGVIRVGARANIIGMTTNPLIDLNALKKIDFIINKGNIIKSAVQRKL